MILDAVERLGEATVAQVAAETGLTTQHASTTMADLSSDRRLDRVRRGVYRMPLPLDGEHLGLVKPPRLPPPPLPHRKKIMWLAVELDNLIAALKDTPGAERDPRLVNLHMASHHVEAAIAQWSWEGAGTPR